MPDVDAVLRAADALVGEAQRRARGETPNRRSDLPLDVLRDLDETLEVERRRPLVLVEALPAAPPPPAGATWCYDHRRFDLCHGDAA